MEHQSSVEEITYPFERIKKGYFGYQDDLAQYMWPWKDKYKDERIFVVGNGSSLEHTPMEKMIGEHSFATNKISDIYPFTKWRPTLFQCMTSQTRHWLDEIHETIELGIPSFVWWRRAETIGNYPNVIWTDFYHERRWERDASKGLMRWGSSGMVCIQLAMYMGFNPIILVGYDGNFRPVQDEVDPNHFSDNYLANVTDEQAARWNSEWPKAHWLAKGAADALGIEVIDATINGSLTMWPKGDIHDICR